MKNIKIKKVFTVFAVYILLNIFILGFIKVYTVSYNTINADGIAPASVTINENNTEITLLKNKVTIENPKITIPENQFGTIYVLSQQKLRLSAELLALFMHLLET